METNNPRDTSTWILARDPLHVVAFEDPVIDQLGHDVRSDYVETYWLPVLGPSAVWAGRRLVDWLDARPEGVDVDLASFGRSLGLGGGIARHSPIVRTLSRLVGFGLAATGGSAYAIRRRFPPLTSRHVQRLPAYLAERHRLELEAC